MNPTSIDAMPPPLRRTSRLARRIVDAVLIVLAVAGLAMFVGAPMVAGPHPWPLEKATQAAAGTNAPARPASAAAPTAEARR